MAEHARLETLDDVVARVMERRGPVRLLGLRGAAPAVVASHLVRAHGERPVLVIVPTAKASDAFVADLRAALGEGDANGRVRVFPRHDTQPYERFSPQPFLVAQRMDVLYRWLATASAPAKRRARKASGEPPPVSTKRRIQGTSGEPAPVSTKRRIQETSGEPAPVVVAPWTALLLRVPSRDEVRARSVHLEVGQTIDRDALALILLAAGYARMPLVEERGELAVRGGILDIFPPQRPRPVRIELLGDEVESIREFDPASQRSQETLGAIVAPPPREILVERNRVIARSDAIRALAASQKVPARAVDQLLDSLLRGTVPPGCEALAPFLQSRQESVLDFLPEDTLVLVDDPEAGRERLVRYALEMIENHDVAVASGRVVSPPDELGLGADALLAAIGSRRPVMLDRLEMHDAPGERYQLRASAQDELRRELARARSGERALGPLAQRAKEWRAERWRMLFTASSLSHAERLRALLAEYDVPARVETNPRPAWRWSRPGAVEIHTTELSAGFSFPLEKLAVVTEEEIFGPREKKQRARAHWPDAAAVESLGHLAVGDHLVHAQHGIGVYRGLVGLELRGIAGEFLRIDYAEDARLLVPVHRLNLIQRYAGADGHAPRLDKLGGVTWERTKRGVRKSLRSMAQELLSVHAARELAPGHPFSGRDHLMEEFEARFPHEETPDQEAAIEDVLADLQRPKPADRLVCGDVGYGKTEVAVRAAFRAAMDGKQVAVLVPTTILCQQHAETFRKRFEGYPVNIGTLSRFTKPARSREVIAGLADGRVDIVIGTHRLLQANVRFRDLGLLVIDEEHRFGVRHKERIKQLKKTVDVLTLTATPIPRTLQLAFTGLRDLSVIETPPVDRLAIRTHVCRFSESLVREAILRELRRGGQIFYVHNRVQSIEAVHQMLSRNVPEARLLVAHGQMRESELEDRMLRFMHGEADVLLCTTIIESGLDIPRANTILVDRADALGLAQLYQLRGRVGRSRQRAYAYLMTPPEEALSREANRRLTAIQELAELGSGFRLANMDLEIRGAGNLMGPQQSGNLAAVGFDTYMEMLQDTIDELRGKLREVEIDPEIRLPVPARLPELYVPDVSQRLILYKRLASCRDDAEVARIRDELLDRFGSLPAEAENLLDVIRVKHRARRLGVVSIDSGRGEIVITAGDKTLVDPRRLVNLLTQASGGLRVTPGHKIHARAPLDDPPRLFEATCRLLDNLSPTPA
jgi:transcription-repair coupling factor (superfamily II helicase)